MDDNFLQAATELSLSPRKSQYHSKRVPSSSPSGLPARHRAVIPSASSISQNAPYSASLESSTVRLQESTISKMPRGHKRPRASLADADITTVSPRSARRPKLAGLNIEHAIVISDDDDPDRDPKYDPEQGSTSAELVNEQSEPPESSPEGPSLASLYAYQIPTKPKLNMLKAEASSLRVTSAASSIASSSSSSLVDAFKRNSSVSTPATNSAARGRKKTKLVSSTIQPKKTIEAAKAAGVSSQDLSAIAAAGFRLLGRCSFCAGSFTKSASAKVKQEHMLWCAPMTNVASDSIAVATIASDIRNAFRRNEEDRRKVENDRTVFQQMVQEADLVLHEGRASQIAASPKKRGKDSVIVKKAIKRTVKPPLLFSEDASNSPNIQSNSTGSKLLPARQAMLEAQNVADQLFGDILGQAKDPNTLSIPASDNGHIPTTPKKGRSSSSNINNGHLEEIDGETDDTRNLPLVSAAQVFASLTSTSPQKSPVKALQKSRERQTSREGELPFHIEGPPRQSLSPNLPKTQPFAPSKLALRQQAQDGKERISLFGAEMTTRSLLDLMSDQRQSSTSVVVKETKRKATDADKDMFDVPAKRSRIDSSSLDARDGQNAVSVDSVAELEDDGELTSPSSSSSLDMDLDEMAVDEALPSQPSTETNLTTDQPNEQTRAPANAPEGSPDGKAYNPVFKTPSPSQTQVLGSETDSDRVDDDDDSQSFLEMLASLEPVHDPIVARSSPSPAHFPAVEGDESGSDDGAAGRKKSRMSGRKDELVLAVNSDPEAVDISEWDSDSDNSSLYP